jgi:hypothetical protein
VAVSADALASVIIVAAARIPGIARRNDAPLPSLRLLGVRRYRQ